MIHKIFLRNSGYSLVELLVSFAIGSIVILTSAVVIISGFKMERQTSHQSTINNIHMYTLQTINNQNFIHSIISSDASLTPILACLEQEGIGCEGYNNQELILPNEHNGIKINEQFTATGGDCKTTNCFIKKSVTIKSICTDPKACEKLVVQVKTEFLQKSESSKLRDHFTEFQITARSHQQRGQIDFSCASASSPQKFIQAINFKNLKANCEALPDIKVSCTRSTPLAGIGELVALDCSETIQASCTDGIASVGLFKGEFGCSQLSTTPTVTPTPVVSLAPSVSPTATVTATPSPTISPTTWNAGAITFTDPRFWSPNPTGATFDFGVISTTPGVLSTSTWWGQDQNTNMCYIKATYVAEANCGNPTYASPNDGYTSTTGYAPYQCIGNVLLMVNYFYPQNNR